MQNNLLKQSESHRPALQFPWTGRSGRLQGSWLWLRHLLSCISTALCRLAEAAALSSCHLARPPSSRIGKTQLHSSQSQFCPWLQLQSSDNGNPSRGILSSPNAARADLQHDQSNTRGTNCSGESHSETISELAPVPTSYVLLLR